MPPNRAPLQHLEFRPAEGTLFRLHADETLLVSEAHQRIFSLNDLAAYIWCHVVENGTTDALAEQLIARGVEPAAASDYVLQSVVSWVQQGLLQAAPRSRPKARCTKTVAACVAGHTFSIRYGDEDIASATIPIFQSFEVPDSDAGVIYDVLTAAGFVDIYKDDQHLTIVTPAQVGPALKGIVIQDALHSVRSTLALHAACLLRNKRCLLLSGRPGAGKSTLALALAGAGFGYCGDDITLVNAAGEVQGLPFPVTLKTGSWAIGKAFLPSGDGDTVHLRLDRKRLRYVILPAAMPGFLPVGWVVMLHRRRHASATLTPLVLPAALSALAAGASSPGGKLTKHELMQLVRVLQAAHFVELSYSNVGEACEVLQNFCERSSG